MKPNPDKRLAKVLTKFQPVSFSYSQKKGGRIVFNNGRRIDFGKDDFAAVTSVMVAKCPGFFDILNLLDFQFPTEATVKSYPGKRVPKTSERTLKKYGLEKVESDAGDFIDGDFKRIE